MLAVGTQAVDFEMGMRGLESAGLGGLIECLREAVCVVIAMRHKRSLAEMGGWNKRPAADCFINMLKGWIKNLRECARQQRPRMNTLAACRT